jgi:hypothetical protein
MGLTAHHMPDPRVATIAIQDDAGNPLATYDGTADTVTAAPGVTVETMVRAFYTDHIAGIKAAVAAHRTVQAATSVNKGAPIS